MKLFYREYGFGKPIIFLHGMLGMSDNWITVGKSFSDTHKIYITDLRNHGLSPHHDDHNFQVMSDDLREFLDFHKIEKTILAGHSMGGKVAMKFAVDHPERIEKLIVIDISPRAYIFNEFEDRRLINHQELLDFMLSVDLTTFRDRQSLTELIYSRFENEFITQLLQKNLFKNKDKGYNWKPNIKSLRKNLNELIKGVNVESVKFHFQSLFLFGNESPYFTQDDYSIIKDSIHNSKIVVIKNAGHAVHIDQKEELINKIEEFLQN